MGMIVSVASYRITFSLDDMVFKLLRSLLITMANTSSALSWRGSWNLILNEL